MRNMTDRELADKIKKALTEVQICSNQLSERGWEVEVIKDEGRGLGRKKFVFLKVKIFKTTIEILNGDTEAS